MRKYIFVKMRKDEGVLQNYILVKNSVSSWDRALSDNTKIDLEKTR